MTKSKHWLTIIGPGVLVAATGVGAGDLATAAFTGNKLGLTVLWAVVLGAFVKYILNEGLARWQLVTKETLLEGTFQRFGVFAKIAFLGYFLLWSWMVGSALMSACGATAHALFPVFEDATQAKIVFGIIHSVLGLVLVEIGGFKLFEKVMSVCIAMMFVTVVVTASMVGADWAAVAKGLVLVRIPDIAGDGLGWTVALMGGIGGTVTVLCYGYWIREEGRQDASEIKLCRLDLAVGYIMTAVFGLAMVIIGSTIEVSGSGATLVVALGRQLGDTLGPTAKWAFLIGAWGAVFSSLLGVWQSVPYLFADFCRICSKDSKSISEQPINTKGLAYRTYLYSLATLPAIGLWYSFEQVQKVYAIFGACFMPLLALLLLMLNGRSNWMNQHKNHWLTNVSLVAIILFFLFAGWLNIRTKIGL